MSACPADRSTPDLRTQNSELRNSFINPECFIIKYNIAFQGNWIKKLAVHGILFYILLFSDSLNDTQSGT